MSASRCTVLTGLAKRFSSYGLPGHVRSERDILASAADATSIVRMYYSFQDKEKLYLVMDYMAGGDLLNLLIRLVRALQMHSI